MKAVLFPTEAAGSQWEMGRGGATVQIFVYGTSNPPYHGVGANVSQATHEWGVVCISGTPTWSASVPHPHAWGVVCISATPTWSASVPHPHAWGVVCISATPTCMGVWSA